MKIFSLRSAEGRIAVCLILLIMLLGAILLGIRHGALDLSMKEILKILWDGKPKISYQILWNVRIPRVLLGAMAGGALAVSGAVLQGVMRNPLAAPGIIGISSGGGLTGILVMLIFPQFSHLLVPSAFCGSLLTATLVYLLAWKRGVNPVRLILAGVAVSSMLGAFSSAILLFNAEKAGSVLEFTIGSLSARSWEHIHLAGWYMLFAFPSVFLMGNKLNILELGDETAIGLGMNTERVRFTLIALASLLAASAVSVVGLLGFVGLIAPHIVRIIIGPDNRFLLPASALAGGFIVVSCDTLGRVLMRSAELPVGIIMALLGPPFFLWLLRRHSYES